MTGKLHDALDALARGGFVVVTDAADRENEADLVLAAARMTPEKMAFLLRHCSGIVCVPMTGDRADALGLPLMVPDNTERHHTAFTVSVDVLERTTTGVSAGDRTATARALADPAARPGDFSRPGHMFPLRAHPDGVLGRTGHTEAAVDLGRLAGLDPVMVICELTRPDGEMVRGADVREFARRHDLPLVGIQDVIDARRDGEETPAVPLPTPYGEFTGRVVRTRPDGGEHLVLSLGDLSGDEPVLVRVHSECATGDLFGSLRCDCGEQLRAGLAVIAEAGRGVLVYERGHEGRGIGLTDKFRAYALQDRGADTVDANLRLGHPADARDFAPAARVLVRLGLRAVTLLTNNPDKVGALRAAGLRVTPRPLRTVPAPQNVRYLHTKQTRLGHDLALGDDLAPTGTGDGRQTW
ncbi:3,4-dihydroxy-2-butanone-4-phosphate synthase [Amycolatopsis thermophila]|uniref:Multifunctional fusion protein n=1 Tax=Amycolatopsis thermophila TaxID=206084 RepID=A0ABU0F0J9_9PSEU|nr:3,4-dihydroxy-2-butanone-4-phosphate synthase [Amycolatopsis thermophila]MDQ0381094.1 3,4-dihydroxy 2-butanone 4-phosphate synthase/GTP cyclohydrolase II [Amycolatopsis thermophila]